MKAQAIALWFASFAASGGAVLADGVPAVSATRVNWAKYQSAWADSSAAGSDAQLATDGIVNAGNAWRSSSGAGGHWVGVTLPAARQVGSVQVFLGSDDTGAITNFSLNYDDGTGMRPLPGGNLSGNTATALNVVLASPVTMQSFMLYTTDASATVREIALLPPNATGGWPLGTDVSLDLARQRAVSASSVDGANFAKLAVDGYAGANGGWRSANANGPHSLTVELSATQRIGSAHLFSGSDSAAALANFRLQYWTGTTWFDVPGGVIAGNTQKQRVINFTVPVSTSRVLLLLTDNGQQTVRELAIFPASSGGASFSIGTSVALAEPPGTKADDLGDNWWKLQNRHSGGVLTASAAGAGEALAFTPENAQHFQVLYNIGTDTFRLRHRATGQCLEARSADTAAGTAVVLGDYSAQPHQLWRIVDLGGGYGQYVNAWSGLALATDAQSPATVTLATPGSDWRQQWQLNFQAAYLKKGLADFGWEWAKTSVSWNYNWTQSPWGALPTTTVFAPMQWGTSGIENLPQLTPGWQRESKPVDLLGFNEPDFPNSVGGSDVPIGTAVALWPQLEAANVPLVSPAQAITFSQWEYDFFGAANALGYRVDFTGVHWYGNPDAGSLIELLGSVYNTYGRPVWLTEFSTVDWSDSQSWSEEDNYRFIAEFLWLAEDQWWLKRYSIFPFHEDPPASPWTRSHPKSAVFTAGGALTAVGDVHAGWDGDRTVRNTTPYVLHGKGASYHLGNNGNNGVKLDTIRANGSDMQWALVPTAQNPFVVYIVSVPDGRRLRCNGDWLDLASPATSGSALEWTYTTADTSGCFFLDCPALGRRLRLNRTNNGDGSPSGIWISLDSGTSATDDWVRWRLVKPAQPASMQALAPGWSAGDIGEPAVRGYGYFDATLGFWLVGGSGADIFGTSDQFQFTARDYSGDGALMAHVAGISETHPFAKAGVMFRNDAAPGAAFAHVFVGPTTSGFEYRTTAGAAVQGAYASGTAPRWVKLVRNGNAFTAFHSTNGTAWTQLGTAQTIGMFATARAGLAVTAHDNTTLNTTAFDNVFVTPAPPMGLSAVSGDRQVILSWNPVAGATSYTVKRSPNSSGPFTTVVSNAATNYTDTNVVAFATYYYAVSATNPAGESGNSAPVTVRVTILAPATLVGTSAVWKYFDQTNDLGTAWRSNTFNDTAWSSGPSMLGFGDANGLLPATVIASNRQWTTYFRRQFYVPDAYLVQSLDGRILRDDGAVVYLNGTEIWRDTNMPSGLITNASPALTAIGGTNESTWIPLNLPPSILNLLVNGTNVLAIEVHQNALTSSDLALNFELTGTLLVSTNTLLTVTRGTNTLALSWPAAASFFTLYTATNIATPSWGRATNEPFLSNGVWLVPLPTATNGSRFYRLQTP